MNALTRAAESSAVTGRVRRVTADSVLCAFMAATVRWVVTTERRIAVGITARRIATAGQDDEANLDRLAAESHVIAIVSGLLNAPVIAWRSSALRRRLDPLFSLALVLRVRLVGGMLVTAVLTHAVFLALLGLPVYALGWSIRLALLAAGMLMVWRPTALAAAWRSRA